MCTFENRLLLLVAFAVFSTSSFCAGQSLAVPMEADLSLLQGHWEGTGTDGDFSVTISDNLLRYFSREDFWWETEFTLTAGADPKQIHATVLKESSSDPGLVGRVVGALFDVDEEELTLGVVGDFARPPSEPVEGDWEFATETYVLERTPVPLPLEK